MNIIKFYKIRWLNCYLIFLITPLLFLQLSCKNNNPLHPLIVTKEDSLFKKVFIKRAFASIDLLKKSIKAGDIITRTGNDFTSESLRSLNRRDQTYSHCGIAVFENDSLFIYHAIGGEWNPDEKLKKEPYELFAEPYSNRGIGIFRFDLPATSKELMVKVANKHYQKGLPFDMDFDLKTNDRMYCAEFIYKTIMEASGNQLVFNTSRIGQFIFVGVDDIFLQPLCKKVAQVVFK